MWKVIKTIVLVVILAAVVLFIATCYFQNRTDKPPEPPQLKSGGYSVRLVSTGTMLYTGVPPAVKGAVVGSRVIVLHGIFENVKGKYVFKDIDLTLDEKVFGPIEISKYIPEARE